MSLATVTNDTVFVQSRTLQITGLDYENISFPIPEGYGKDDFEVLRLLRDTGYAINTLGFRGIIDVVVEGTYLIDHDDHLNPAIVEFLDALDKDFGPLSPNNKIITIKLIRRACGLDLREAKLAVENWLQMRGRK